MNEEINESFAIYATRKGPICVCDGIKADIMDVLRESDSSLSQLSKKLSKPQSTVSVAVNEMAKQGLVESYSDDTDIRKKIFTVCSIRQINSMENKMDDVMSAVNLMDRIIDGEEDYFSGMIDAIGLTVQVMGLDLSPFANNLGMLLGERFSAKIGSVDKLEDVIEIIADFYKKNNIGIISVVTYLPITIRCENINTFTPGTSNIFSSFTEGIFKTILKEMLGNEYVSRPSERSNIPENSYEFILESVGPIGKDKRNLCPYFKK